MIGERLKDIRKDHNLSRKDLGDILSLSIHTIASYERGNSEPNDEIKIKICNHFQISCDYLIGLTNIQNQLYKVHSNSIVLPSYFKEKDLEELKDFVEFLEFKTKRENDK